MLVACIACPWPMGKCHGKIQNNRAIFVVLDEAGPIETEVADSLAGRGEDLSGGWWFVGRVTASASRRVRGAVRIAELHLLSGLFPPLLFVQAVLLFLLCHCCCCRCASSAAPLGERTSAPRMALGAQNYVTFLGCGGEAEPSLCITTKTERIIFNIPEGRIPEHHAHAFGSPGFCAFARQHQQTPPLSLIYILTHTHGTHTNICMFLAT